MIFIGVDPGKTCGLAIVYQRSSGFADFKVTSLSAHDACDAVWHLLSYARNRFVHCAVERYTMSGNTAKMTRQNDAIEVIGALRWMITRAGRAATFNTYGAAEATKIGPHDLQRQIGWWNVGAEDHERRAVSQLLIDISQHQPRNFARLISSGNIPVDP